MLRRLVQVLVLSLVPVLVVTIPAAPGFAAATESAVAKASLHDDGSSYDPTDGFGCSVNAVGGAQQLAGPNAGISTYVRGAVTCREDATWFPGISVVATDVTFAGTGCEYAGSVSSGRFTAEGTGQPGCAVTEVCVTADYKSRGMFDDNGRETCGSITLVIPAPAAPIAGCPTGSDLAGGLTVERGGSGYGAYIKVTTKMNLPTSRSVRAQVWVRDGQGTPFQYGQDVTVGPGNGIAVSYQMSGPVGGWTVMGMQVVSNNPWPSSTPNGWSNGLGWDPTRLHTAGTPDTYMGGMTRPERCSWYIGTKIAEDATSTADEPVSVDGGGVGPVAPPEVEAPTAPESPGTGDCAAFSFTDPTTWAGAGICVLVKAVQTLIGVVGKLAGLVGGLAVAVAKAIGDMLEAAFVPSGSAMREHRRDLQDAATEASDDWTGALDGLMPGGGAAARSAAPEGFTAGTSAPAASSATSFGIDVSSGCKGPGATWATFKKVGLPETFYPLDACTGTVAQVATVARNLLMFSVLLFSLLKVVTMVLTALGLMQNINHLRSFDWTTADGGRLR